MADKNFLDRVYEVETPEANRRFYDEWAASYDSEVAQNEYATPDRLAAALAGVVGEREAPLLDIGCGTGLSGAALKGQGFGVIDGADLSAEMLAIAADKDVYRRLIQLEPGARMPFAPGDYEVIVACGVIGAGAAPASLFGQLLDLLEPGRHFAFSFNDHTLADPTFAELPRRAEADGRARICLAQHGPHLPGIGLESTVFVLERA